MGIVPVDGKWVRSNHVAGEVPEPGANGGSHQAAPRCGGYFRTEFWPDDLSILDQTVVDNMRIHGPKQVTDVSLLALARQHAGRFVTFDSAVPLSAVLRAERSISR